jgi:hypothetical protein
LEGAGNHLTRQILPYWSQNKHLQMRFDVRPAQGGDPEGMRQGINIWGEVYDTRHFVSTGLGTRSRGFVWFFVYRPVLTGDRSMIRIGSGLEDTCGRGRSSTGSRFQKG